MADWVTISSLATAGGTLVLAVATFSSVKSANRSARVAERSLMVGLRPVLVPSREDDLVERIRFGDGQIVQVPGHGGAADNELTVDLEALEISHPSGLRVPFEFDSFARHMLVNGLDDVGLTLQREEKIAAYESAHPARVDTAALA